MLLVVTSGSNLSSRWVEAMNLVFAPECDVITNTNQLSIVFFIDLEFGLIPAKHTSKVNHTLKMFHTTYGTVSYGPYGYVNCKG